MSLGVTITTKHAKQTQATFSSSNSDCTFFKVFLVVGRISMPRASRYPIRKHLLVLYKQLIQSVPLPCLFYEPPITCGGVIILSDHGDKDLYQDKTRPGTPGIPDKPFMVYQNLQSSLQR